MYQHDPDVRWGLHLVDVCSLSNGYPETVTCYEQDSSWTESVTEGFCNPAPSFEGSNAYPSGFPSSENHHQGGSSISLDWPGTSDWNSNSGRENPISMLAFRVLVFLFSLFSCYGLRFCRVSNRRNVK